MQAKARQELVPQSAKDGVCCRREKSLRGRPLEAEEEKPSHGTHLLDTAQELQALQAPHTMAPPGRPDPTELR
jgi:hypothetical protein